MRNAMPRGQEQVVAQIAGGAGVANERQLVFKIVGGIRGLARTHVSVLHNVAYAARYGGTAAERKTNVRCKHANTGVRRLFYVVCTYDEVAIHSTSV